MSNRSSFDSEGRTTVTPTSPSNSSPLHLLLLGGEGGCGVLGGIDPHRQLLLLGVVYGDGSSVKYQREIRCIFHMHNFAVYAYYTGDSYYFLF